jgi:hypothetical protein
MCFKGFINERVQLPPRFPRGSNTMYLCSYICAGTLHALGIVSPLDPSLPENEPLTGPEVQLVPRFERFGEQIAESMELPLLLPELSAEVRCLPNSHWMDEPWRHW